MDKSHYLLKDRIQEVFDRAAPTYDRVGPRFFSCFGQRLVGYANLKPGSRVLDVATGAGAILFPAAEAVGPTGSIIGIDLSPEMVKRAQQEAGHKLLKNITIACMDAEKLEFPDSSFDYVLCGLSLSFFPELHKALTEFKRVLQPGGMLAVSIWGPGDMRWNWMGEVYEKFKPYFISDPNIMPAHFHEVSTLETALTGAGFQNIRTLEDRQDFIYTDANEWWMVQWSHVNRALLESIQPGVIDDFKEELFRHLKTVQEPDGIHQLFGVIYAFAQK